MKTINGNQYELLAENEASLLWVGINPTGSTFFESWFKMLVKRPKIEGQIHEPKDEDFGVWAWSFYSLEMAKKCFDEITSGEKKITPMIEALDN